MVSQQVLRREDLVGWYAVPPTRSGHQASCDLAAAPEMAVPAGFSRAESTKRATVGGPPKALSGLRAVSLSYDTPVRPNPNSKRAR